MRPADPRERLAQLTAGSASSQAIFAAAELGIADLIARGETSLAALAQATGSHPHALWRLMRYLVSIGLFDEKESQYSLTPMGQLLQEGVDGSRRARLRMLGRFAPAWAQILYSVKTSESAFHKAYGKALFEHLEVNPEDAAIFDSAMTAVHGPETAAMIEAYDFSGIQCLADIGGGNGSVLIDVLKHYPALRGILFDRPHVVARARSQVDDAGLSGRCSVVGGDFFQGVREGADAYLLRHIIHDWYDPQAVRILNNCRRALPAHGRVLVVEMIVPEGNAPSLAKEFDLSMLVLVGGQERTQAEYRALFEQAGLRMVSVTTTSAPISIMEARVSGTAPA